MKTWEEKKVEVLKNWEIVKELRVPLYYADVDEEWAKWDCKFHFRENRSYRLPKDLDFWSFWKYDQFLDYIEPAEDDYDYEDWLYYKKEYEEMTQKLDNEYYWQWLDWYEHSAVAISIAWTWMQCRRDTSNKVWIVAIPKSYFEWQENPEEKAYEYLKNAVDCYSDCFNGWVYEFRILEEVEFSNPNYWTVTEEVPIESDSNWYLMSDSELMEKDIEDNVKYYLEDKWIEYDEIKIY